MKTPENIHPEFHRMLGRVEKERLLGQKGAVIWLFGMSGSGKSTLANALERRLHEEGRFTQILDGDNVRSGLNRDLGFSVEDRRENLRRIAEVAKLFKDAGVLTLVSFITPLEEARQAAREIIGAEDLALVYVKASFEACAERDPKGLYAKGASGELPQFTREGMIFEAPQSADLILENDRQDLDRSLETLYTFVQNQFNKH